jgi:exonuclease SbcD
MKILHFADLHLGVETYGTIDASTGLSTRMLDILKALDHVVDYAVDNKVDLVLFCGDTYKNRDPSQTQQREFARRIKRLSQAEIPVFLLVGNHDLPNAIGRATAIEIFDTLSVSHVSIGNRFDVYRLKTKDGYVQIVALPWPRRSALLSREEAKDLNIDQVNDRLQEIMTARLLDIIETIDPSLPTILAAHVSVSTAKSGSEASMLVGREPVLLLSNVAQQAFDYVALGHIHKTQVLNNRPPVIYAGSLERLDFSDEDQEKGFYIVDIDIRDGKRHVDYEFHSIDARRFVTIPINIDNDELDPMTTILETITSNSNSIRDSIARIQLTIPKRLEPLLHDADIYKVLKEAYYVTVGKEIVRDYNSRSGDWQSEGLTPVQALKKYLDTKNIPESRRKTLLEFGERLIEESTIVD